MTGNGKRYLWRWLELVGERLGLLGWWKGRGDMYGLNVGDGKVTLATAVAVEHAPSYVRKK